MKQLILSLAIIFSFSTLFAQTEVSTDASGEKIIKGFLTKKELVTDSSFTWFAENAKGYVPEAATLAAFRQAKDSVHILAFGGTWCSDSKYILPKFFSLTDAAGWQQDRLTILGVDRDKKTIQHLSEAFAVTNVPTFIVLKNGVEIGRVVEYGKTGMFDRELADILKGKKAN